MKWKFEKEFRADHPETIGETDKEFDLDNYKDWLEHKLANLFAIQDVSNNEVRVAVCTCKHPENQRKYYNDAPQFFCFACGSYVRTDC